MATTFIDYVGLNQAKKNLSILGEKMSTWYRFSTDIIDAMKGEGLSGAYQILIKKRVESLCAEMGTTPEDMMKFNSNGFSHIQRQAALEIGVSWGKFINSFSMGERESVNNFVCITPIKISDYFNNGLLVDDWEQQLTIEFTHSLQGSKLHLAELIDSNKELFAEIAKYLTYGSIIPIGKPGVLNEDGSVRAEFISGLCIK